MGTTTATQPETAEGVDSLSGAQRGGLFPDGSARRLVALSALMLFTELALIRWSVANNVRLVSLTNFVLLASFLGIGLGFLRARSRPDLFRLTPLLTAVLIAFVLAFPVRLVALQGPKEFEGLNGSSPLSQWVSLPIIFLLVVAVMAGLGQEVGRTFERFRSLDAYRYDILGSLAGIIAFAILSFIGLPPAAWGAVVTVLLVALLGRAGRWWQWAALGAVMAMLIVESLSAHDTWSPYYKITAVAPPGTQGTLSVSANNIPYQTLYPLATLHRIESFYFFPYRHATDRRDVLIIGAGTGNDVGVALSEGAQHVDAVEIDPGLVALGRRYNPEHAYQSARVSLHVNDGRAYIQDTAQRYSLILYSLPDSLTALTGQAAPVGLENYLLTTGAIRAARAHLAPGGTFAMYNYYQPFLLDRYAATIQQVFGSRPCVELGNTLSGREQAVLTVSLTGATSNCNSVWPGHVVTPVSDDRPFPYLPGPSIPGFYLLVLGLILGASLVAVRAAGGPLSRMSPFLDLFWMGAAFMLLETKNIVQFALLFGTTWFVNALVFGGVLVSVYAAVETARHIRLPRPAVLYAALLVSLAVSWVVPQQDLLGLALPLRMAAATALAFAPVFIANLVFSQRFKEVASSTTAFGANLLGAIVGGAVEYVSLIMGFRFLLLVVAVFYGLAFVAGRRRAVARVSPASAASGPG